MRKRWVTINVATVAKTAAIAVVAGGVVLGLAGPANATLGHHGR